MKEEPLRQMPKDLGSVGRIMSNFSHEVDSGAEERLRTTKGISGQYTAKNFFGCIWYAKEKFWCEIWQYHEHINTLEANSLERIMELASDQYGWQ